MADTAAYLSNPTGMQLVRGKQSANDGGLLELLPDNHAVELTIPKPEGVQITVPVRISGFNKRWTVGNYQVEGYRTHYYSKGNSGWTELGLDFEGRAYVPMFVSQAPKTHMKIGHPIVADEAGKDIFIQVTRLNNGQAEKDGAPAWHVSVNNPTDAVVTTTLKRTMDLPGLDFEEQKVTVKPGEYKVLLPVAKEKGD
jgi:hypothetical protein